MVDVGCAGSVDGGQAGMVDVGCAVDVDSGGSGKNDDGQGRASCESRLWPRPSKQGELMVTKFYGKFI